VVLGVAVRDHLQPLRLQSAAHREPELPDRGVGVAEQSLAEARVHPRPGDDAGTVERRPTGEEGVDPAVDLALVEQTAVLEERLDVPDTTGDGRAAVVPAHDPCSSSTSGTGSR
jgi:hypothetical protein